MISTLHWLTPLAFALSLAGCEFFGGHDLKISPLVSVDAIEYEAGAPKTARQLTPEQKANLSRWLDRNKSGWSSSVVTHAPRLLLTLNQSSTAKTGMNVTQGAVVINQNGGQIERTFSEPELAALKSSIGAKS